MAPSYTNLLTELLEHHFLLIQGIKPQVWWRVIHDIVAIWTHGEQLLHNLIVSLNHHHSTVKFTAIR